jgi:hypothetical protein
MLVIVAPSLDRAILPQAMVGSEAPLPLTIQGRDALSRGTPTRHARIEELTEAVARTLDRLGSSTRLHES